MVPVIQFNSYISAEEELKRQKAGYGQVEFNYDAANEPSKLPQHGPEAAAEEPDDPFEPMPNFEIPRHIDPVGSSWKL